MSEMVRVAKQGEVMVITIDNPPVNALSPGVPEGIASAIDALNADAEVRAAVLIGAGKTFVAGADIKEFVKMTSGKKERGPGLLPLLLKIEDSKKPVIVAIHGQALGGGLELAMAGNYRVAVAAAQVGQPEVKLGIIPGAAGTQRLPRLAGVAAALEMCTEGKPIPAEQALKLGIVDRIIDGDLLEGAVTFAREVAASGKTVFPKTRARNEKLGALRDNELLFENARASVRKKQRGLKAPLTAIDAIEAATREPFESGCATEQKIFTECLHSEQSKALIHVFFAEREVAKIPDVPRETATIPVKSAVVIGAGTMGGGIAMVLANAGIPVTLKETEQAALDRGLATIGKNYAGSVKRGRMTQADVDERMKLITTTVAWEGVASADLVIEAVFENMALKKEIFAQLDALAKPGAILASNTSTLSIDEIASATKRPESVIGLHFFSPANVMKLLEVVRGKATSKEVIATSMQLAKKIGKIGVLVGNCRGFVGNRMFQPYRREAQFLVEEGAEIAAVDKALYDWGMAMGPLSTADLAGLDIGWRIRKEHKHLDKPGVRKPFAEERLCEMGRFGQKTGVGWYKYDENRVQTADPLVKELIAKWTAEFGVPQRAIGAEEIVDRCIYALVNEGAKILEEGYALRAGDIDIIYVNGYGFPAHRGGPMWYADTVGLKKVLARVEEFEKKHRELWTPAPLLRRLAEEGKTFAEFGAAPAA
jgi:3-hydroxyacyl-CoA dehydrogenase